MVTKREHKQALEKTSYTTAMSGSIQHRSLSLLCVAVFSQICLIKSKLFLTHSCYKLMFKAVNVEFHHVLSDNSRSLSDGNNPMSTLQHDCLSMLMLHPKSASTLYDYFPWALHASCVVSYLNCCLMQRQIVITHFRTTAGQTHITYHQVLKSTVELALISDFSLYDWLHV